MSMPGLFRFDREAPQDIRSLAFIGDAVCHLYARQRLCTGGAVKGLTQLATAYASASGQARAAERIAGMLTEEEADMLRRGRNAKCGSVPRGCDPLDYRKATGFEALMGWLYLLGRTERLQILLDAAFAPYESNEKPQETSDH